jgi:hypothetical protein
MERRLATGSGAWAPARMVVITDDVEAERDVDAIVVRTHLELITILERSTHLVSEVIVSGSYAANTWLRVFLEASYPTISVSSATDRSKRVMHARDATNEESER